MNFSFQISLPGISATEFNYPVDIFSKWRGSKYSFITRYRSGFADNAGKEFNAPFWRLDYIEECLDAIQTTTTPARLSPG